MPDFVTVAKTTDIPAGEGRVLEAGGKQIALFNVDGNFHAIDNTCIHQGGPLGEGILEGTTVTCPWHAWMYDVASGQCTFNTSLSVATYKVKVEEDEVKVAV